MNPQRTDFTIKCEWTHHVLVGESYVDEEFTGDRGRIIRYGPMHSKAVLPFIAERCRSVSDMFEYHKRMMLRDLRGDALAGKMGAVVVDKAGIKSAPPQETAGNRPWPVADGGAEPLPFHTPLAFQIAIGKELDAWANHFGVYPRFPAEPDDQLRTRIAIVVCGPPQAGKP